MYPRLISRLNFVSIFFVVYELSSKLIKEYFREVRICQVFTTVVLKLPLIEEFV